MFFTVWGKSKPSLERSLLDGSERIKLVTRKIVYPYGVTVDYPTQHVYWVDTYLDVIERINYDGSLRITIKKGATVGISSINNVYKLIILLCIIGQHLTVHIIYFFTRYKMRMI